jgi:RecA-family ATPase
MIHGISAKDCKGNFFVSKRAMQVLSDNKLNAASAEVFAKAVGEIGIEPALVVIDTVGRSFGQGDENSAVDVNTFVEELDKAFRHKFGCNVLLIHHHGKNKSEARGSSAFLGAMDSQFDLNRLDDGQIELSCCKAKDGAQPEPIYFELKEVQLEILDEMTGKNETSVTLIKAQPKQKIDPMVKFLQAVNSGASSRDEIQATSNLRNDTISQLKKQAIEQELIKVAGGKQTVAGLTDKGQEYLLKHDDFGV